jgi:hypothetical protein
MLAMYPQYKISFGRQSVTFKWVAYFTNQMYSKRQIKPQNTAAGNSEIRKKKYSGNKRAWKKYLLLENVACCGRALLSYKNILSR